jgi:hypothetical protein
MTGRQELSAAHAARELARGALALHHGVLTLWVASWVLLCVGWCGRAAHLNLHDMGASRTQTLGRRSFTKQDDAFVCYLEPWQWYACNMQHSWEAEATEESCLGSHDEGQIRFADR